MFKFALIATALMAAVSTAAIENVASAPASGSSCRPGQAPATACNLQAVDDNGDGTISAVDLANLASPAAASTPLQPIPGGGLAFQDAATEPGTVLPASPDRERPQPLVPALFALGALVVLLRRRPN